LNLKKFYINKDIVLNINIKFNNELFIFKYKYKYKYIQLSIDYNFKKIIFDQTNKNSIDILLSHFLINKNNYALKYNNKNKYKYKYNTKYKLFYAYKKYKMINYIIYTIY